MQVRADKAGLSQPFLSKVERGMARLSMRALDRVALALGTTAVGLFGGTQGDLTIEVVRSHERPELPTYDEGSAVAHALTRRAGQLRIVEFASGPTDMPDQPFVHRNDAITVVLEGTYEFEADGVRYLLWAGDTFSASGGIAHTYRVVDEPARMMLVIVSEDVQVIPDPAPLKRSRPTRRTHV